MDYRNKISQVDLVRFAESDSDEQRQVLIHLVAPQPTVDPIRRSFTPITPEVEKKFEERKEAVKKHLEQIGVAVDKDLGHSATFVAHITPEQLREVAEWDSVRGIHPNEKREVPPHSMIK
jgi:hypothetical protein